MKSTEFSMQLLAEAEIEKRRARLVRWGRGIRGLLAAGLVALLEWLTFSTSTGHGAVANVMVGAFLGALISLMVWVVVDSAIEETRLDPKNYDWLPSSECADFADFCEKNQEVQSYRDQVRAAGRRFTKQEYSAMEAWVDELHREERDAHLQAAERAGCQKLYGIPVEQV